VAWGVWTSSSNDTGKSIMIRSWIGGGADEEVALVKTGGVD
jgi:hypothetical protein